MADGTLLQTIEIPASALEEGGTRLAGGFLHEMAHVRQGYGVFHQASIWADKHIATIAGGGIKGKILGSVYGLAYILNPTEMAAFASGIWNTVNAASLFIGHVANATLEFSVHPSERQRVVGQIQKLLTD